MRILIVSAISSLLSVASFGIAISVFATRLTRIQESRRLAATDTCDLLTRIVLKAAGESKAPDSQLQAELFLKNTGLASCATYAAKTVAPGK